MTIKKDLKYLRKVVKTWPKGATHVRLDRDGEVCFAPDTKHDFRPKGFLNEPHPEFIPRPGHQGVGTSYTKEQFMGGNSTNFYHKAFKDWLERNRLTAPFLEALSTCDYVHGESTLEGYLNYTQKHESLGVRDYISYAFNWTGTRQGHNFWCKVNTFWLKYVEENLL